MDQIRQIDERQSQLRELIGEMHELSQPRSNFALRHFVVGQHDMPARQRQQAVLELQGFLFDLANQADEIKLIELDLAEMRDKLSEMTGNNLTRLQIEIGKKERSIEQISIHITGRLRECDTLYAMLQEMPKFNAEQLEAEEETYWANRLSRQYFLAQRDAGGNLTAILQMLTEPGQKRPELAGNFISTANALGLTENAIKKLSE